MANLKLRYDENTFLVGNIYPEYMNIPEPFLLITEEQSNEIVKNKDVPYFVIDGELTTSKSKEYIAGEVNIIAIETYKYIIDRYDNALKCGVFKIDDIYYANMAWYDTWSKAIKYYEDSTDSLPTQFTVRLYKKLADGKYYNYNTTQNLTSLKNYLTVLSKQQFSLYQPINNNLMSRLLAYKATNDLQGIQSIKALTKTAFGDYIDESNTIVQYGV